MNEIVSRIMVVSLLLSVLAVQVQAASQYDVSMLETPVVPVLDYTETPLGTLDSLGTFVSWLIEAAGELIKFINSIFGMLGMADDTNIKELMEMYESGMEMVEK